MRVGPYEILGLLGSDPRFAALRQRVHTAARTGS
jgi:hypothetical protein